MGGVLFLNWSAADVYFWFWYDFALAGLLTLTLIVIHNAKLSRDSWGKGVRSGPLSFLFAFSLVLFYASLFTTITYMGQWKSWHYFPQFLSGKIAEMVATFISFAVLFGSSLRSREWPPDHSNPMIFQFCRRSFVVLGLYLAMQVRYYYVDHLKIPSSATYLKFMVVTLLALKAVAELGCFDRWLLPRNRAAFTGN